MTEPGASFDRGVRDGAGNRSAAGRTKHHENFLSLAFSVPLLVGAFFLPRLLFPGVVDYVGRHDSTGDATGALLLGVILVGILVLVLIWSAVKITLRKASRLRRGAMPDRHRGRASGSLERASGRRKTLARRS
jgi:hypothetical protein